MKKEGNTLSDADLIKASNEWVSKLAKTGGKAWSLSVPVNFNRDPDMIFCELANRLSANKWIDVNESKPEAFKQVLVFGNYYGHNHMAEFVCCGDWQIHGWSTDRDGWADLDHLEVTHWAYINLPDNPNFLTPSPTI